MRVNLETSELLYEVRFQSLNSKENYTYEQLYKNIKGEYFIHFIGGKYSEYAVKTSYDSYIGREGNYCIDESEINLWKKISNRMKEEYSNEITIIDWEKEKEESIIFKSYMPLEELPF
ncbi:hypothetical protein FDB55_01945 [Clostridium botulinum]|uniref:hypothetical protein n=1 Tax=Clostridium botulinum TaxID=1491 RepID=UPI0013F11404|nr:hypothetical protein [Clostridium botulinum]MCS6110980.1 hypothetical protein [Clostridium botulinum]NFE10714.1 hypothetical protein [Clostridium botulinum]NFL42243.1 hypothetical protein [Clostridium botulinum]NFN20514.1 hypothetical protein [Clostridium botulinum]NFN41272.1 hypothetical protein [Clostridium botulinum]